MSRGTLTMREWVEEEKAVSVCRKRCFSRATSISQRTSEETPTIRVGDWEEKAVSACHIESVSEAGSRSLPTREKMSTIRGGGQEEKADPKLFSRRNQGGGLRSQRLPACT